MATDLATLTLDAAAGGLFGLIGTALGRVADFLNVVRPSNKNRRGGLTN